MTGTLVFTHIPKTAGTSLKKSAIFPNVERGDVYWSLGIRKLLRDRGNGAPVVLGHVPYGVHRFLKRPPYHYVTVLRDPVDRAVSFYNYVRMCEHGNPGHPGDHRWHPALPDAKRYPIDEFYQIETYRNAQAKFTAGFFWNGFRDRMPTGLRRLAASDDRLLRVATHNLLHRYWYFGLLDRIDEAEETIARALGGQPTRTRDRSRQTSGRSGLVDPTPEQRERIRQSNALDVAFYDVAVAHYDRQSPADLHAS